MRVIHEEPKQEPNSSHFITSATFPRLDPDQIKREYPADLRLVQVQFIHRHGQRTPLSYRLPQYYPFSRDWCKMAADICRIGRGQSIMSINNSSPNRILGDQYRIAANLSFVRHVTADSDMVGITPEPVPEPPNPSSFCYLGQLTDVGRSTLHTIGLNLRHLYVDQLNLFGQDEKSSHGDGWWPGKLLRLRSTNFPRTIESLQSLVEGLILGSTDAPLPSSPPIEITVRDDYFENMYATNRCARFKRLFQEYRDSVFLKESAPEIERLSAELPHIFSQPDPYGHPPTSFGLYDTLISQWVHGAGLPPGVRLEQVQRLERLTHLEWFDLYRRDPEILRLCIGRFIGELVGNCQRALAAPDQGASGPRMLIYSGHDSTIGPLRIGLSLDPSIFPPFASNLAIETFVSLNHAGGFDRPNAGTYKPNEVIYKPNEATYKPKEGAFVRVRYNGQVETITHCAASPLRHYPGHPDICTWSAFHQAVSRSIPMDYLAECRDDKGHHPKATVA